MVTKLPIKCIDNLEVTCQLIKNYSITVEDRETCKPEGMYCKIRSRFFTFKTYKTVFYSTNYEIESLDNYEIVQ